MKYTLLQDIIIKAGTIVDTDPDDNETVILDIFVDKNLEDKKDIGLYLGTAFCCVPQEDKDMWEGWWKETEIKHKENIVKALTPKKKRTK